MKLLKLQMHPWCFHFLGNPISCLQLQEEGDHHHHHQRRRVRTTIKIIKSDGVVKIYDRPIHVSELMMEFPKHLVCRSDSFYIGQKIPPLSENEKLQLGHSYFLLPNTCFQKVLSFVTIASFASRSASLHKAAASSCQLFDIQRSPSGCPRIRVSDEFISQMMAKEEGSNSELLVVRDEDSKVCTTAQLHKDYKLLVGLRRRWKPKLETIKEKEKKKLSSSFGIGRNNGKKRRNKLSSSSSQKSSNQKSSSTVPDRFLNNVVSSSSSNSKSSSSSSSKIKIKSRK